MGCGASSSKFPYEQLSQHSKNYFGIIMKHESYEIVGVEKDSEVLNAILDALRTLVPDTVLQEEEKEEIQAKYAKKYNTFKIKADPVLKSSAFNFFDGDKLSYKRKLAWTLVLLNLQKIGWEHVVSVDLLEGQETGAHTTTHALHISRSDKRLTDPDLDEDDLHGEFPDF